MRLDKTMHRLQRRGAGPDLVGERRQAEVDALAGIALALPVQRLMLTERLEQENFSRTVWITLSFEALLKFEAYFNEADFRNAAAAG